MCPTCLFEDEPRAAQSFPLRAWISQSPDTVASCEGFLFFGWAILLPMEVLLSSFQIPASFHSYSFLLLFCYFLSKNFWHRRQRFRPQECHKMFIRRELAECRHYKKQPFIADARLAHQQFAFFTFAPIYTD